MSDEENGKSENRKIFIGGVPYNTDDFTFTEVFKKYGEIEDIVLMKDKDTGQPRGFGFVTYRRKEDFEAILHEAVYIGERQLDVKVAVPRSQNNRQRQTSSRSYDNRRYDPPSGGMPRKYSPPRRYAQQRGYPPRGYPGGGEVFVGDGYGYPASQRDEGYGSYGSSVGGRYYDEWQQPFRRENGYSTGYSPHGRQPERFRGDALGGGSMRFREDVMGLTKRDVKSNRASYYEPF